MYLHEEESKETTSEKHEPYKIDNTSESIWTFQTGSRKGIVKINNKGYNIYKINGKFELAS